MIPTIEEYCHETGRDLVNGFKPYHHRSGAWSNVWDHDGDKPALYLTKLHGSVFWHKDTDGNIVETGLAAPGNVDNGIMIPPTEGEKDYGDEPFPVLTNRFRETVKEIDMLVVIGFSYRDKMVVDIIKEGLGRGMALISISRTADKAKELAPNDKSRMKEVDGLPLTLVGPKIILYKTDFGPNTIKDVQVALRAAYKLMQNGKVSATKPRV